MTRLSRLIGRALCWMGLHKWVSRYRPVVMDLSTGSIVDASTKTFVTFMEVMDECNRMSERIADEEVVAMATLGRTCARCSR
jgi:hypothetical protein